MSGSLHATQRQKNRNLIGIILGVLGATIIFGFLALALQLNLGRRDVDDRACPRDHFDSVTAVLIDLTDPLNPVQAAALKNAMLKVRGEIPRFGRLEIYPLRSTSQHAIKPPFAACNPGSAKDVESPLTGNPALADRIWYRDFADKIDEVLATIQTAPREDRSPILEGIQSVAVTAFGAPLAENAPDKRLVLVSDMIHYTQDLSMYAGAPSFDSFKSTSYYLRVKPNLQEANVDVFLIVRDTKGDVQQPPLYEFWVEFVTAGNGYLRDWTPLQ